MFTALPKADVARVLGRQVLRSGTPVGANYREAYRSRSRAEFVSKLGDCLKELEETSYWLSGPGRKSGDVFGGSFPRRLRHRSCAQDH